jgi:hypothetical protein
MGPTSGAGVVLALFELGLRPAYGGSPELGSPTGAGGWEGHVKWAMDRTGAWWG